MSTTTGSECVIAGDKLECPADAKFSYAGANRTLLATIACPLDARTQSEFIDASQKGLCTCGSSLVNTDNPNAAEPPIQCNCYACPIGSRFGFAYECNRPITGPCDSFNCNGDCNGEFNFFLDNTRTFAPTGAPTSGAGSLNHLGGVAMMVWLVVRMIR